MALGFAQLLINLVLIRMAVVMIVVTNMTTMILLELVFQEMVRGSYCMCSYVGTTSP